MKRHKRAVGKRAAKTAGQSLAALIRAELAKPVIPGQIVFGTGDISAFQNRSTKELTVKNSADRPIQVGSHCHFFEVNRGLLFDREEAFGFRLCIPAGTAARFEPGEEKRVTLVAIAGHRAVYGINGLTDGALDDAQIKAKAMARAADEGFIRKGGGR